MTGEAIVWSALSLIALLGGIGIVLALYGRYANTLGWHESEERRLRFVSPADVPLTPAQRTTAWYFFVVAALFVLQNVIGVAHGALPGRGRPASSASTCPGSSPTT